MLSYFHVIPHEVAVQRYARQLQQHAMEFFGRQIVLSLVSAATLLDTTSTLPRPPRVGRPLGSFNVRRFVLSWVC